MTISIRPGQTRPCLRHFRLTPDRFRILAPQRTTLSARAPSGDSSSPNAEDVLETLRRHSIKQLPTVLTRPLGAGLESMEYMTKTALYARVSTDTQQKEGTIKSQVVELKRQIAAAGHALKEYIDDGYRGAQLNRPALEQMRTDLKTDAFDAIYFPIRIASPVMLRIRRSSSASLSSTASRSSLRARITLTILKTSSRSPARGRGGNYFHIALESMKNREVLFFNST